MIRPRGSTFLALAAFSCLALAAFPVAGPVAGDESSAEAQKGDWVCPPCGAEHDEQVFDEPGTCPVCGMTLVKKNSLPDRLDVGILLFDGVQIIDYTGPYEVFGQGGIFDVYTVSETGAPLTTAMGMKVTPSHSFESAPAPDILLVPGGDVHGPEGSPRTIAWVREAAQDATYVMSVCNGAFILAKAGLLEGQSATTFYGMIDDLRKAAPNTKVVADQRWVDNGKVITTAGLSSGIDGSLHLISKIRGMARAKAVALHMEYDWDPESDFARAALADRRFPDIDLPDGAKLTLLSADGDREEWTTRYEVKGAGSPEDLAAHLRSQIGGQERWKPAPGNARAGAPGGGWTTVDENGATWRFTADIEGETVTLHIRKKTGSESIGSLP